MSWLTNPTEPRLRRRRRLVLWTILPALVLLVLAARFLLLPVHMGDAQEAHRGDDGSGMVDAAEKLSILNIVERWRAPFVEGTGKSMQGDLPAGRADLERALGMTKSPEDDCTVRTNLVLTVTAQGDEAGKKGDTDAEKKYAEEALKLIEEGPDGCLDGSKDGNGGEAGRKQREAEDKNKKKTGQSEKPDEDSEDEQDEDEQDEDEQGGSGGDSEEKDPQEEELEERNGAGQRQSEQERKQREGGGGPDPVEKPW